jgi:hypothetical protein
MMTLHRAKNLARGYMAPRNEAINIFAQTGRVTEDLIDSLQREHDALERYVSRVTGTITKLEVKLDLETLDHLITWLTVTGAIVASIEGAADRAKEIGS